jgi:hypothetical protein
MFIGISALASVQPDWFAFAQAVPGRDKLFHCLGAGLVSLLSIAGFPPLAVGKRNYGRLPVLAAIVVLITVDEVAQAAIASRTFDLADLGWSYAGIGAFGLPAIWLARIDALARSPAGD